MAFRQPVPAPRQVLLPQPSQEESNSTALLHILDRVEQSQEWVLFSPSQAASTTTGTQTERTPHTAGLSRLSDFGSLATKPDQPTQSNVDDAFTEDGELDTLDDGLQAFGEPSLYRSSSNQGNAAVLPTHDGLGTFQASNAAVQDQLWQHEQYNSKRKHEGNHDRRPSVLRRLDTIEELDLRITEEKRMRIEQWRMEQSQALLKEIEKETRRRSSNSADTRDPLSHTKMGIGDDPIGKRQKQGDLVTPSIEKTEEVEPFWKRVTRKFIRDVIGIDEPLLSVIVGETLPQDMYAMTDVVNSPEGDRSAYQLSLIQETWPDRLLHRIARELGLLVNKLSPHPGAFSADLSSMPPDYAGIPISERSSGKLGSPQRPPSESNSQITPLFSPTIPDRAHDASWGLEYETACDPEGPNMDMDDAERLRREREYWERELDIKMVFRFLKSRFTSHTDNGPKSTPPQPATTTEDPVRRADAIRRHHPLVARAHQPTIARLRRDPPARTLRRSASSCASESVRSSRKPSLVRSNGSSRNYWDIGGSMGSGSAIASAGTMGAWGEV